jgi:hypothetical protein
MLAKISDTLLAGVDDRICEGAPADIVLDAAATVAGDDDLIDGALFTVRCESSSSSDSESSLSESPPTVDGLLMIESGLSGSSISSSPGTMLATGVCRRTRVGNTVTGDGR